MNFAKKLSIWFLSMFLFLGISGINVFAATQTQDGLEVTLTTDKESYSKNDPITISLSVKNTNDFAVSNISLESIIPDGYKLSEDMTTTKEVSTLNAGESVELTATYVNNTKEITPPETTQTQTPNDTSGNGDTVKTSVTKNSQTTSKANATSTGDSTNILFWIITFIVSILCIVILYTIIKLKKRKQILSIFLAFILVGSIVPLTALETHAESIKKTLKMNSSIQVDGDSLDIQAVVHYDYETNESGYTKAEWVSMLVDAYGYPMVEVQGESSFTDIPNEYKEIIETAVSYGILIPENDGEEFNPNDITTREFAALTAVRSLGYQLTDDISCADLNSITYPKEVNIAVAIGLLPLENNCFYPQRPLSSEEATNILNLVEKIYNSTQSEDTGNNDIVFKEETIVLDSSVTYEDNGTSITLPADAISEDIENGSIIVIGRKDAFKVTDYTTEGENYIISYTTPDFSEFLESMNIDGKLALDFSQFVPAEGVTVDQNSSDIGISTFGFMDDAFDIPATSVDTGASVKLSGNIDLGDDWKIDYSLKTAIPTVDYKFDIDFGFLSANVKNAYFKIQQNTDVTVEFGKDFDGSNYGEVIKDDMLYKYIPLGRVPALGVDGIGVVVEIDLVFNAQGKIEVVYNLAGTIGCQVLNNNVRNISALQSSTSVGLTGEAKLGPKIGLVAEIFDQDLISFSADAGVRVGASVNLRSTGMVCVDGGVTLYAELNALENTVIDDWLDVAITWTIWDENNSPLKLNGHFENMQLVEECTYTNGGIIKGTVANADDRTQYISDAKIEIYNSEDLSLVKTTTTDSNGQYNVSVPGGTYVVAISAEGYIPFESLETVMNKQEIYLETYLLVEGTEGTSETGIVGGNITDSVTGANVSDVKISIRKGWNKLTGDIITSTQTDSNGSYKCELALGNYTVQMEKDGYVTNHINIAVTKGTHMDKHGTLVPTGTSEIPSGDLRIVLTWGEQPYDLDSHLVGPNITEDGNFHIYFSNKQYRGDELYSFLDVDDTSSYGPETITIYKMNTSGRYSYYVHDYSNRYSTDSIHMSESGAQVKVYAGEQLIATYNIPTGNVGTLWHVFDFDATSRQLIAVNEFSNQERPSSVGNAINTFSLEVDDLKDYEKADETISPDTDTNIATDESKDILVPTEEPTLSNSEDENITDGTSISATPNQTINMNPELDNSSESSVSSTDLSSSDIIKDSDITSETDTPNQPVSEANDNSEISENMEN